MKVVSTNKFKWLFVVFTGITLTALAQKQTKQYNESFSVGKDVTIDISTNYTDVEFETWNKNVVEVEAQIEIEGISKEEAEDYFKRWDFEAMGNSEKIRITTKSGSGFFHLGDTTPIVIPELTDLNFDYVLPEVINMDSLLINIKEIPMPSFDHYDELDFFDYEAYKEQGEAYLEEWKKEFNENFDKNFKPKFEEWRKDLEVYREKIEKEREHMKGHRKTDEKQRKKVLELQQKALKQMKKELTQKRKANTFFYRSSSEDKNIKIKRTIKIKMPKGVKLKMNVRHGEVKLAEHFKNIKATLSHTRLLATKVDGEHTDIEVSYAPVLIDYWHNGRLKLNYVKDVAIQQINSVHLSSTSSNVHIGNIAEDAIIEVDFGKLQIENVADNFKQLDVFLDNTDAIIALPKSAFDFYCSTTNSTVDLPKQLLVNVSKSNYYHQLAKGYHKQKNSNKNINVTAMYSDVIIR